MPKRRRPPPSSSSSSLSESSPSSEPSPHNPSRRRGTRHTSVYDAVAHRVNYEGFVHNRRTHDARGELHLRSQTAQTADEVLGRRRHAPSGEIPYAEGDVVERLPDSDLLIALHQYAADFYAAHGMGSVSYRSMDETALLAVGMLLEETVKNAIGPDGDLALVEQDSSSSEDGAEAATEDEEETEPPYSPPRKKKKTKSKKRRSRVKVQSETSGPE